MQYSTISCFFISVFVACSTKHEPASQATPFTAGGMAASAKPALDPEFTRIIGEYVDEYLDSTKFCIVTLVKAEKGLPTFQLFGIDALKSFLVSPYLQWNFKPDFYTVIHGRMVCFYTFLGSIMQKDTSGFFQQYAPLLNHPLIRDDWNEALNKENGNFGETPWPEAVWWVTIDHGRYILNKNPVASAIYPELEE